jgi:hypothetical protein
MFLPVLNLLDELSCPKLPRCVTFYESDKLLLQPVDLFISGHFVPAFGRHDFTSLRLRQPHGGDGWGGRRALLA